MFFLLYRHTNECVIDDFPKILQNLPEGRTNVAELCPKITRRLPKTFEEDPNMFRSYTNEFKYNLREKLDIGESIDMWYPH